MVVIIHSLRRRHERGLNRLSIVLQSFQVTQRREYLFFGQISNRVRYAVLF